ncbi:MAG TPA: glycosyltransferase family A protein [Thermoleophilaceae bacterium]|nr:glycosyltransferase family A protein [Thermoleophilaceae bacterium]
MPAPLVSVVVPTADRASYLEVALASIAAQEVGSHEVVVVDDGSRDSTPSVVERSGARSLRHDPARGANAARNAGIAAAASDLIVLVDDDIAAPPGWLRAYLDAAERHPEADVIGGPIRASLEGPAPRMCGREAPPVTTLDLGPDDREAELVWSANMLVRRRAVELAGPFDESLPTGGDEEEWLERLRAAGGRVWYAAAPWLDHRRTGDDARLRSLMRSAYHRGRNLRAFDARRGAEPSLSRELRVLAGCGWHTVRRACPQGLVMGAHSLGRTVEAVRPR